MQTAQQREGAIYCSVKVTRALSLSLVRCGEDSVKREMDRAKPTPVTVTADFAFSDVVTMFRELPDKDLKPAFPSLSPKGGEVLYFSQRMIGAKVS